MRWQAVLMMLMVILTVTVASQAVTIDWVTVGNAGNPDDIHGEGYGGVGYVYQIGKYEVTAGQYTEFLNAVAANDIYGLYNAQMWSSEYGCKIQSSGNSGSYSYSVASDYANRPVNYVSWYDALRFTNWLHNGQGTGDTEDGAYDMSLGSSVVRKAGATVWLPSDDEWYKAAYYEGGGVNAGYWDYATQSNLLPDNNPPSNDTGNSVNYYNDGYAVGPPYYTTAVGAYSLSGSAYNTYDQNGNVAEWNEAVVSQLYRVIRGGRWYSFGANSLIASYRQSVYPTAELNTLGFRVASVPEPATVLLLGLGGIGLVRRRGASGR